MAPFEVNIINLSTKKKPKKSKLFYKIKINQLIEFDKKILRDLSTGKKNRNQLVESIKKPRTTIYDRLKLFTEFKLIKYNDAYKQNDQEKIMQGRPTRYFNITIKGIEFLKILNEVNIDQEEKLDKINRFLYEDN